MNHNWIIKVLYLSQIPFQADTSQPTIFGTQSGIKIHILIIKNLKLSLAFI